MRVGEVSRLAVWIAVLLALVVCTAGCGDDTPSVVDAGPTGRWACPATWVASAHGGCGPAVLLCTPGGGAAAHACDGVDLSRPPVIALPDGGTARGFYRLPDGGIGGGWPEPGDPDGPPDVNWAPDAGITACAEGWRRLDDGTCDPMLRGDCPEGSGALPGGACTPTALSDCPRSDYADPGVEAMGAVIVHVRSSADAATADGTLAHPYATITAAIANARDGAWVLIAAGEYREQVTLTNGTTVHVLGVCAARVTLRGPGPPGRDVVAVTIGGEGTVLDLRGVTITGTGRGLRAERQGRLRATGVVVADNVDLGIGAFDMGTQVEVSASVVRGNHGHGLAGQRGASLRATGMVVEGNDQVGVAAFGEGTLVELSASVVRGTRPHLDGVGGHGLEAQAGATLRAMGVVVEGNTGAGILANGIGTRMEVTGSVVRGTHRSGDGIGSAGLRAEGGASLQASGVLVEDNADVGIDAANMGTLVELNASVVRETRPQPDGLNGQGLYVGSGALLRAMGMVVDGNTEVGILAIDEGTQVEVSASIVRSTHPRPDGVDGDGLVAQAGALLRATRVVADDNAQAGIAARDIGTRLEVSASVVRRTHARRDGLAGHGLEATMGASLRATTVVVDGNAEAGIGAFGEGTQVEVSASVVRGTHPHLNSTTGDGLVALEGASLRATGVVVDGNTEGGIYAADMGTQVEVTSSVVRGTHPNAAGFRGFGMVAYGIAMLRATGVLYADNIEMGVNVQGGVSRFVDVLVVGVSPSPRGLGVGLFAWEGAQVNTTRMALQSVGGAGVVALPYQGVAGTRVTLSDLFVREVHSSTVRFDESGHTDRPVGRTVAYGLHAGAGCAIDATNAVLDGGGFGFYNAGGEVRVHQGVISRQLDSVGAIDLATPATATTLDRVVFHGNVSDVIERRADLPTASLLPAPTPFH